MGKKLKISSLGCFLIICMVLFMFTSAHAKRDTLIIQTWGGGKSEKAINKAFVEPFIKETGIKAKTVAMGPEVFGKLPAMVKSNNIEFDITTSLPKQDNEDLYNKGLYDTLDYSLIKKNKDVLPGAYVPFGVGTALEWYGVVYNTNAYPAGTGPKTWKDFWDVKKFPGPRGFANWGGFVENLMVALIVDGANYDTVFPLDLDRAFKSMNKIKPHINVWFSSGAQLVQILRDEEVVISMSSEGRTKQAIKDGAKLHISWDAGWYFMSYFSIVKNTPMKEEVHEFFNVATRPENQAIFTKISGYPGSNPKSVEFLDEETKKNLMTSPHIFPRVLNMDTIPGIEYKRDKKDLVAQKWNAWLAE